MSGRGPAYDAFEMAVCDLVGRARKLPVHALLGGAVRSRVRADYWIGHQTPEDGKRSVARLLKQRIERELKEHVSAKIGAIVPSR